MIALFIYAPTLEPVTLIGQGEYNLNELKEVMVTDSYIGLDQAVRKCQNNEPFFNCTTKNYINSILDQCGCLPLNLNIKFKEVVFQLTVAINCISLHFKLDV